MGLYRGIEKIVLGFLNLIWKWFILIHECKNIFIKRKIFKEQKLSSEQKKSIDDFYKKYYGKKIPDWWHRLYTSYTGKFDYKYIPEYIYSTKLELNRNRRLDVLPLENKNMLYTMFHGNVKLPEIVLMRANGQFFDRERRPITDRDAIEQLKAIRGVYFAKISVDSSSGRGVRMLDIREEMGKSAIVKLFSDMGKDFVIQKKILPHPTFAKLYPNAINTLRVVTYISENNVKTCPIVMRIGQGGGVVDNAHAGGIFIGVDDDGKLLNEAFTEYQKRYMAHPDTGVVFKEYQLPCIPEIKEKAVKLHKQFPMLQFVSWDFTVDNEENIVLIEVNLHSQAVWLSQIAHGKSMFGDDTAKMLQIR